MHTSCSSQIVPHWFTRRPSQLWQDPQTQLHSVPSAAATVCAVILPPPICSLVNAQRGVHLLPDTETNTHSNPPPQTQTKHSWGFTTSAPNPYACLKLLTQARILSTGCQRTNGRSAWPLVLVLHGQKNATSILNTVAQPSHIPKMYERAPHHMHSQGPPRPGTTKEYAWNHTHYFTHMHSQFSK